MLLPGFVQNKKQHPYVVSSHLVFFSERFVRVQVVQSYNSTDTATALKNSRFNLTGSSNSHLVGNLSIAVLYLSDAYVGIAFSRWDIATEVYELVDE